MSDRDDAMKEGRIFMDCAQFKEVIRELDRPEVELTEEALSHAECCDSCAALLTETESLDFALRRIAEEAVRSAPPRIEAAVLQEFKRAQATTARRRMQRQLAGFGVAAALLLAAGLAMRYRVTPMPTRVIETGMQVGAGPSQMSESPAQNVPSSAKPEQPGLAQPANATVTRYADMGTTEAAQEFTPLPYADDPSMIEGGTVVRVIMSRSALASFGVPLTDAESRDRVPADLVVSADGTPEAIRLVAENVN